MLIRSQDKEILANMEGPIAIEILSDGNGHTTMRVVSWQFHGE